MTTWILYKKNSERMADFQWSERIRVKYNNVNRGELSRPKGKFATIIVICDVRVTANVDRPVLRGGLRSKLMESTWPGIFSTSTNFLIIEEYVYGNISINSARALAWYDRPLERGLLGQMTSLRSVIIKHVRHLFNIKLII